MSNDKPKPWESKWFEWHFDLKERFWRGIDPAIFKTHRFKVAYGCYLATLVLTTVLVIFYFVVSDSTWWGELVTIWPPFFWCFGLIPMTLLAWHPQCKRLAISCIGAVGVYLLLTNNVWKLFPPEQEAIEQFAKLRTSPLDTSGAIPFRLITWNVDSGAGGMQQQLDRLAEYQPDLCLFQESPDLAADQHPAAPDTYFAEYTWLDAGDCALLSRFPVEQLESQKVGPWSPPQVALVEIAPGRKLLVLNVRLMLPSLRLNVFSAQARQQMRTDHVARTEQYWRLANLMLRKRPDEGVIIAGDFNTPGDMWCFWPLNKFNMRDAWNLAGHGWGGTITSSFPVSRIDQCWVDQRLNGSQPRVRVVKSEVILGAPSDHRALMVDLLLLNQQKLR